MDCNALAKAFPNITYLPSTPQYEDSTNSYFAAFENELQPACVLAPRNTQEAAEIIKYLQQAPEGVKIAIRGGGHTPWAGSANINAGVTIDVRRLTGVTVDGNNVISIAAGEVWANVYITLEGKGLAVVGGRVSKVGVTGLTIGGNCCTELPCTLKTDTDARWSFVFLGNSRLCLRQCGKFRGYPVFRRNRTTNHEQPS